MVTRFVPRQRCCWVGLRTSQFSNYIVTLGYYWSQILLFGAEFTQVYADRAGREVKPDEYALRVEEKEVEARYHLALATFFSAIHMRPKDNPAEGS
jgi:hypothetical protein